MDQINSYQQIPIETEKTINTKVDQTSRNKINQYNLNNQGNAPQPSTNPNPNQINY